MAVKGIHVRIDELVLHGVRPADRHRIEDALRAQLERALRVPGVLGTLAQDGASLDRLVLPAVRATSRADRLGAAIADALVSGLTRLGAGDPAIASAQQASQRKPPGGTLARAASAQQSPRRNPAAGTIVGSAASPQVR